MYKSIPSLAMLKAFEIFGREGGIRKTARQLDVDHAIVSRHLRALEEYVGTALINRTESDQWLTPDGMAYHARLSEALREIADATEALKAKTKRRLLVWCAPGLALQWLNPRLSEFHATYPDIDVELRPTDKAPDFATNEADADIRYVRGFSYTFDRGLQAVEIARPHVFPVASPAYLVSSRGVPETAADMLTHRLLHEDDDSEWVAWLSAQGLSIDHPLDGPRLWQAHLTLDAARNGRGIALANELLLRDDLASGRLVKILPKGTRPVPIGSYQFISREDRWRLPRISRLRNWLRMTIPEKI